MPHKDPDARRAYEREYWRRHRTAANEKRNRSLAKNPDHYRAYFREWHRNNRWRRAEQSARWRAKKLGASFVIVDYGALYVRDNGVCHKCGATPALPDVTFDHVTLLARGGAHHPDNIRVCCFRCNCGWEQKA